MVNRADILVRIDDDHWTELSGDPESLCQTAARAALAAAGRDDEVEVSILLTSDAQVQQLNRDYRHQDKPTNVLSFATDDDDRRIPQGEALPLGDIVVAFGTVRREAESAGISLTDHTSHMIVHGTLHLLHYDHEIEEEAVEMEALETAILAQMGISDPYAHNEN
ncbi:MAG: rRNA maturation RNase YbeY [Rhodospirillales bacterium]